MFKLCQMAQFYTNRCHIPYRGDQKSESSCAPEVSVTLDFRGHGCRRTCATTATTVTALLRALPSPWPTHQKQAFSLFVAYSGQMPSLQDLIGYPPPGAVGSGRDGVHIDIGD